MDIYASRRRGMVRALEGRGIGRRVLDAMERVPRHLFVPEHERMAAYEDTPLPIGEGQTISAPHMVAFMCDLLDPPEGGKVLEVGGGMGYHAAVLAELVGPSGKVITVERLERLAKRAERSLALAGYTNVEVVVADGTLGYPEEAPFDSISVACSAPSVPPPLCEQLKIGGRMVIPIGAGSQTLYLVEKTGEKSFERTPWGSVIFVPLIGKYGFDDGG